MKNKQINKHIYCFDFETSDINLNNDNNRVIAYNIQSTRKFTGGKITNFSGVNLSEFMEDIFKIVRKFKKAKKHKKQNFYFYSHNGSSFDTHFILKYFGIIYGNKHNILKIKKNIIYNRISELRANYTPRRIKNYDYDYIIDNNKKIYQLRIYYEKCYINFRCSLLLLGGRISIKNMGVILNKQYPKLNYLKGEIDYSKIRYYKNLAALKIAENGNFYKYLLQDVNILVRYLWEFNKILPVNFWKMTSSSTAYSEWLKMGYEVIKNEIPHFKETKKWSAEKGQHITSFKLNGRIYTKNSHTIQLLLNHILPTTNTNIFRDWFVGGITQHTRLWVNIPIKNSWINSYDVNSAYPHILKNELLPYGKYKIGDGGLNYPLKLYTLTINKTIYNKNGLPFLIEKINGVNYYQHKLLKGDIFKITSVELLRFKKYYKAKKGDYNLVCNYSWKGRNNLFNSFVDKYYSQKIKATNTFSKDLSKLFLNSLYGKFATKNERESKIFNAEWENIPKYNEEGAQLITAFEIEETIEKEKYFLPIGIFTTAYARMKLIDAVNNKYKYFLYCDTDSIYTLKKYTPNFEINPLKLGAWKQENKEQMGIFFRKKGYVLCKKWWKNFSSIKVSGFQFNIQEINKNKVLFCSFKGFIMGKYISNNNLQKRETKAGFKLENIPKQIKPINDMIKDERVWKYYWYTTENNYYKKLPKQEKLLLKLMKNRGG